MEALEWLMELGYTEALVSYYDNFILQKDSEFIQNNNIKDSIKLFIS